MITTPRYRKDYTGEFVITKSIFRNGAKEQEREWVPNQITNEHISGRAAIIGSGISKNQFPWPRLKRHRGGLLGRKKLQTYGSDGIYKKIQLDFYVSTDQRRLQDIISKNYQENNVVYTSAANCLRYRSQFYLTPYSVVEEDSVTAAYLAAFDEHKEIFLLGYDQDPKQPETSETIGLESLMKAYPEVQWTIVSDWDTAAPRLTALANCNKMTYREFITYCDV